MELRLLSAGKLRLFLLLSRYCFHDEMTIPEDTITYVINLLALDVVFYSLNLISLKKHNFLKTKLWLNFDIYVFII